MSNSAILKLLRPVLALQDDADSDAVLLRRFHATRDERAFADIVQQYGRLVWSVCRQMLNHDADAEDAYQATFLALIRFHHTIRGPLAPWLHQVAYRVSIKLRHRLHKQTARDHSARRSEVDHPVPDSVWETMLATVHEEIAKLPEKLRVPLVLCCMEGTPVTEAARAVGWKLGTFSARLTQAKQMLMGRLSKRGLPLTAAGLSLITISQANAVAPIHLNMALQLLQKPSLSPLLLSLSQGVVVVHTKMKLTAVAILLFGIAGTTGWIMAGQPPVGAAPSLSVSGPQGAISGPTPGGPISMSGAPGGMGPMSPPSPSWEYQFVQTSPRTANDYRNQFQQMQQQGYEFCGTVPLQVNDAVNLGGTGPGGIGGGGEVSLGGTNSGGIGGGGGVAVGGDTGAGGAGKVVTAMVFRRAAHTSVTGMMMGGRGMGAPGMSGAGAPGLSGEGAVSGGSDTVSTEATAHQQLRGAWQAKRPNSPFHTIVFSANNQVTLDGREAQRYYINPGKNPMHMNIVGNGSLLLCIYQINDGVLKLAFYGRSETDRPERFSVAGESPTSPPMIEIELTKVTTRGSGPSGPPAK